MEIYSKKEIDQIMNTAKAWIEKALDQYGNFSHNIVSNTLRGVSMRLGFRIANQLIHIYELDYYFDIQPVELDPAVALTSDDPQERAQGALEKIYEYYIVSSEHLDIFE